jgi:glutathione S-transferase
MKLFYSPNSPFARKARVIIREKRALGHVSEVVQQPLEDPAALREVNPLGQVPVLVLDDGSSLFDSPVICEYLDATLPGQRFLAADGAERWAALRHQALADGIMGAAVSTVFERLRKDAQPSPWWVARWRRAIDQSVEILEHGVDTLAAGQSFGGICVACALAYLDFRHPDIHWRENAPRLAAWSASVFEHQSFQDTMPLG